MTLFYFVSISWAFFFLTHSGDSLFSWKNIGSSAFLSGLSATKQNLMNTVNV